MTEPSFRVMMQYIDYPMGASTPMKWRGGYKTLEEAQRVADEMNPKGEWSIGTWHWAEEDKEA
jgi:hypothetical protein